MPDNALVIPSVRKMATPTNFTIIWLKGQTKEKEKVFRKEQEESRAMGFR